ncbi:MAG: ATP-grasp domain-containing protein [Melioribacteraceae bacterium]|jgi:hypothetical protein|nr:ATP-grasp domain-containing protein [Melioribacteraceae bacterium]
MIIIDKPIASEFLIETIKRNNYPIIATVEAREMLSDNSLNWITESEAEDVFANNPETPVYTNSENSISWIEKHFNSSKLPSQIDVFKNKIKFRELIKDSFPNYFYKGVKFEDLRNLNIEELAFPFIVKPAVGFFSIAVHKVDSLSEWEEVLNKIDKEIETFPNLYPKEVINLADFIIEEFVEGEEFAIDCYFDNSGEPVLLNILHHLFSSDKDVSDRVYSTSESIIEKHKNGILNFLKTIGKKVDLKNFPSHVEVRVDKNGEIFPIEVNPLRFGGWCTTGDLSWFAYGFNSYQYFLDGKIPDWEEIFNARKNKRYSIIVLDNNSGINSKDIFSFDYNKLLGDFSKPLDLRKADFSIFPVFGFLFVETTDGNNEELKRILSSNLREFIKLKNGL